MRAADQPRCRASRPPRSCCDAGAVAGSSPMQCSAAPRCGLRAPRTSGACRPASWLGGCQARAACSAAHAVSVEPRMTCRRRDRTRFPGAGPGTSPTTAAADACPSSSSRRSSSRMARRRRVAGAARPIGQHRRCGACQGMALAAASKESPRNDPRMPTRDQRRAFIDRRQPTSTRRPISRPGAAARQIRRHDSIVRRGRDGVASPVARLGRVLEVHEGAAVVKCRRSNSSQADRSPQSARPRFSGMRSRRRRRCRRSLGCHSGLRRSYRASPVAALDGLLDQYRARTHHHP